MDVNLIDINCDLGEGLPNDASLMPFISSCSIACGGHFGTKETMRTTIRLAQLHRVKIGAHPSYPDHENFGRKSLEIPASQLEDSLYEQLLTFFEICNEEGVHPNHIKLHGALYNDSATNETTAALVRKVYEQMQLSLPMFCPPNSVLSRKIKNSQSEAFIDRRYNEDGSLVARINPKALIDSPISAWKQLSSMYFDQELVSLNDTTIPMYATTFCLHGDSKNAVEIAEFIFGKLSSLHIQLDKKHE